MCEFDQGAMMVLRILKDALSHYKDDLRVVDSLKLPHAVKRAIDAVTQAQAELCNEVEDKTLEALAARRNGLGSGS